MTASTGGTKRCPPSPRQRARAFDGIEPAERHEAHRCSSGARGPPRTTRGRRHAARLELPSARRNLRARGASQSSRSRGGGAVAAEENRLGDAARSCHQPWRNDGTAVFVPERTVRGSSGPDFSAAHGLQSLPPSRLADKRYTPPPPALTPERLVAFVTSSSANFHKTSRWGWSDQKGDDPMNFEVAPLPYSKDALEPVMKQETLEFHYEKHHKGYMTNLKGLLEGKPEAQKTLEEVIKGELRRRVQQRRAGLEPHLLLGRHEAERRRRAASRRRSRSADSRLRWLGQVPRSLDQDRRGPLRLGLRVARARAAARRRSSTRRTRRRRSRPPPSPCSPPTCGSTPTISITATIAKASSRRTATSSSTGIRREEPQSLSEIARTTARHWEPWDRELGPCSWQ